MKKSAPDGLAKTLGQGFRDKDTLVSQITRHIQHAPDLNDEDRNPYCIHPSEAAKGDAWCTRATYYRMTDAPADPAPRKLAFEMVFERGHDAHNKWQTWLWEMDLLWGMWECLYCDLYWWDKSPYECPRCESGRKRIRYREVPVSSEEYLLAGQADGLIDRPIEVKSIGPGTVRIEAPALLKKYSYEHTDDEGKKHTGTDWYQLWQGIRRPWPSHIRQGMIYCFCAGWKSMTFIYDPKFLTAWPKEFEVKFRKDLIEDTLEQCLTIKNALEKGRPPKRPMWANQSHASCKACPYRGTCYAKRGDRRPGEEARSAEYRSEGEAGEGEPRSTRPSKVRYSESPAGHY